MPGDGATVLKKLLIGLSTGLATLVAVALVVPSLIDWNNARGWIALRLGEIAGRPVVIGGEVNFAMLPTPRLIANGVAMANDAGDVDLLTVREMELRVLLPPLLLGRIEVEQLSLVDPILRLQRVADTPSPPAGGIPNSIART